MSPENDPVTVEIVAEFGEQLCREAAVLFAGAGWIPSPEDGGFLEQALPGSCAVAGAFCGGRLIGIARALYRDVELLILDEATSNLDSNTENAFISALETLAGKLTMVVIAHRLNTLEKCDKVINLNEE